MRCSGVGSRTRRSRSTPQAFVDCQITSVAALQNCRSSKYASINRLQAKRTDITASYYNSTVTALRFLYLQALGRDWKIERLPYGRREHPLPVVLSRQEVFQLWRRLRQLKRRVLLMTAYSRPCELPSLVHLRVEDLDPKQKLIHVKKNGAGDSRFVPYSPTLADA